MITGIDETGDFQKNGKQYCYFVAVHLDQNKNKLFLKQTLFNAWENSIRDDFKSKGEVKAKGLPEKYLDRFYFDVIDAGPSLAYSVVKTLPENNPETLLQKHKELESIDLERVYKQLEHQGKTNKGETFKNIFLWHKRLKYDKFLKLRCLYSILGLSFNQVILGAQFFYLEDNGDDSNFKSIQFKIDKDFIQSQHARTIWNEMFAHFWLDFTKQFNIPIIQYPDGVNNPINNYFVTHNGRMYAPDTFGPNTNFLNSKDHFEIRMADLIGYIFHRYENHKKCQYIGKRLLETFTDKKSQYHELVLAEV